LGNPKLISADIGVMEDGMAGFQKGDVVKLKSGGPDMTVTNVANDGRIQCHWFPAINEKPVWEVFPLESLKMVPSSAR
jgi:uncharacterized protein YodC (DUF2158 family)